MLSLETGAPDRSGPAHRLDHGNHRREETSRAFKTAVLDISTSQITLYVFITTHVIIRTKTACKCFWHHGKNISLFYLTYTAFLFGRASKCIKAVYKINVLHLIFWLIKCGLTLQN